MSDKKIIMMGRSQSEKANRKVTYTNQWKLDLEHLNIDNQLSFIRQLSEEPSKSLKRPLDLISKQITQKMNGYKYQDQLKDKYCEGKFIDMDFVIEIMLESGNQCYYCLDKVYVLYEQVRDPKQWTLERIDNAHGHNKDNVVICCLHCNLHRRTMYHERYAFTKQLVVTREP